MDFILPICSTAQVEKDANESISPKLTQWAGNISLKFEKWDVVVVPGKDEAEWWAGAPSVVRDDGTFWLAVRMRTANAPLGLRGYEIRIFRSEDGIKFTEVHSIKREDVPIPGFERPALLRDPKAGKFKLYGCVPLAGPWCIFKFEDANCPDQFDPSTAKSVIEPLPKAIERCDRPVGQYTRSAHTPTGYKDPFIIYAEGAYHCFVIGSLHSERLFHFVSMDGDNGSRSKPVMDLTGWHTFAVRPASVVPLGIGYLFVYEGSDTLWPDASYNIAIGLGLTFDLHHVLDLTPDNPLLVSPTPGRLHTWRYSHWMWVGDEFWVYAEVEKENGAHEIRLYRLPP